MSFISVEFLIFFPVVTLLYFAAPHSARWFLLLIASCIFYMAFIPLYILVLLALIAIDYSVAIAIENSTGSRRRHFLLVSIASLVGVLFVFKYFNFFSANMALVSAFFDWKYPVGLLTLALPIGLSFHTFQSLSYVFEVYRGKQKAERHLGIYALYVMFYPQLVAGPIERPQHLLHQFYEIHSFDYDRIKTGLLRMVWGFFKKVVVADRLGLVVDYVFLQPSAYHGVPLVIASIFFTLQLFFDFSAYCDIALGAAQVMGFTLVENFNRPFRAHSIVEFWRRWHISLSSWFRDYFFLPLAFSWRRFGFLCIPFATLITFLVTGFWHGANWTYGIFGLLHGGYIVVGEATRNARERIAALIGLPSVPRLHALVQNLCVFLLMTVSCIFFRAVSLSDALYTVTHLFSGLRISDIGHLQSLIGISSHAFAITCTLALIVFLVEHLHENKGPFQLIAERVWYVRWPLYWALTLSILVFFVPGNTQFIYFQF